MPRLSALLIAMLPVLAGAASAQDGLGGMKLNNSGPISIEGDRLEVLEDQGIAIFTGAVNVVQDATSMKAGKLTVYYDKSGEGSVATGSAAIKRLEMENQVVLRSPTQTATGDAGSFDMASEVFVLTGRKVVLTEGQNVAVGCKLTVQMKTGEARIDGCKSSGRVQIMINPKSAKGN